MRVCLVTDIGWPAGGAEKSVVLLRDNLTRLGHSVRIISTDKLAEGRSDVFADTLIPHIGGSSLQRLARYFFYRRAFRILKASFREFEPDVIHFHTVGELSPSSLYAAGRIPFLMTVHGPEDFTLALLPWHLPASDYRNGSYRRVDLRMIGRLRYLYLRALQRPNYLFGLRPCRSLIAPSAFIADALLEDAASGQIIQLYNGIELPPVAPQPTNGRFLFVGRLEAVKGVDILLRAIARARTMAEEPDTAPDIGLDVIGDGTQRPALEALADDLELSGCVKFRGWQPQEDVISAMAASAVLVIPSVWPENLPTVALEALGIGRAIVGSRVGGIPELVMDGITGYLVDPYDINGLADRILALARDPALCASMGRAARHSADKFDAAAFVESVAAIYQESSA